jgi:hypothetical protein
MAMMMEAKSNGNSFESPMPTLCPAAKGSLLCFCRGEVVEMLAHYGWLMIYGNVDHPLAGKHGGHVYVSKRDIKCDRPLEAGEVVTFYLYEDSMGLGAEVCRAEQSKFAAMGPGYGSEWQAGAQRNGFANTSWSKSQHKWHQAPNHVHSQDALQTKIIYYMPVQLMTAQRGMTALACNVMSAATDGGSNMGASAVSPGTQNFTPDCPQECTSISANMPKLVEGELPSLGSAGHADGTCKRCAFYPKGRCQNGVNCTHCHFEHSTRLRQRKRNQKVTRATLQGIQVDEHHNTEGERRNETDAESTCVSESATCVLASSASLSEEYQQDEVSESDFDAESSGSSQRMQEFGVAAGSGHDEVKDVSSQGYATDNETRAPSVSSFDDEDSALDCHVSSEQSEKMDMSPRSGPPSPKPHGKKAVVAESLPSLNSGDAQQKPVLTNAICEDGPLAPSPTSWSAQQRLRKADRFNVEANKQEIVRAARALLNKLTKDRFDPLCEQILALPVSTHEHLDALATEIFEKATTQHGFRSLYIELCVRLDTHFAGQDTSIGGKAFRKSLANGCQASFERNLQPVDEDLFVGLTSDERFEVETKFKTRRLGNMKFIGELLSTKLLAPKLMLPIMHELLTGSESSLESLIAFLVVVAPIFDQPSSVYAAPMRQVFAKLRTKMTDNTIASRMRFQLRNLFDARARGWDSHHSKSPC